MAGFNTFYASLIYGQPIKRAQLGDQSPLHSKHAYSRAATRKWSSLHPGAGLKPECGGGGGASLREGRHICKINKNVLRVTLKANSFSNK